MDAHNRFLPDWLVRVRSGQLALPRFQRFESWSHGEVGTLLDTILRGRPIGAALVLAIGDNEPFVSRAMAGAPKPTERTTEHLLDGQQRLTALWKALNDGFDDRTYFAVLPSENYDPSRVRSFSRWSRNGQRYPLWVDQPDEQFSRGLVPISLLNPAIEPDAIRNWCDSATNSILESRELQLTLGTLVTAVREANLPYLELPVDTPPEEAIDVFIQMNTTSVRLSAFDIVVAQLEAATGRSLHELEGSLRAAVPEAERYVNVSDLVLRVAALREDRTPTESSFMRLDLQRLANEWEAIERGVGGAIRFLIDERVYDRDRLPTVAVVPILASIWSQMPQALDAHGEARTVLRQYLWRSFFTDRYDRAAATAALQDYRGLRARILDRDADASIPVLDELRNPLVEIEELERAPWPRLRNTLARAILAVSLRAGGRDFADDTPASWEHLSIREYHHLFPESLLDNDGMLDDSDINLALNCALVTWNTNRNIGAKEPIAYLRERAERATLGKDEIRSRLDTHIIPFDKLNVGGYDAIPDRDERGVAVKRDYESFIRARAEAIHAIALRLCSGEDVR
ncbi:MAG: DUF262 domain-containing protein [Chloroflexi bacterium]|nr:DUF262 domain-containing protein [Chloroflexota bacterium]